MWQRWVSRSNRAAVSKLFSYALECGEVDTHPLVRFPKLKEPKKVFRPLTVQQFRDLVKAGRQPARGCIDHSCEGKPGR